jgi:DNA-binding NtrC family response regulator
MSRLLLVDPDEASRAVAALLRHSGHEVIETDEDNALLLYREGVDAVFVWPGQDSMRAATLLQKLAEGSQPQVSSGAAADTTSGPTLPGPELVGHSAGMCELRATVHRLAQRPHTHVLVAGEPGTGKQTVARVLHLATRAPGELVHVGPERLAAFLDGSALELAAQGGTLYLSDLGSVSKVDQRKLVTALAEHEGAGRAPLRLVVGLRLDDVTVAPVRVLRDVAHPELVARLPVKLELYPLRKRKADIPLLVGHFLDVWTASSGLRRPEITPEALSKLASHCWPGNLRELANVIEQAALTNDTTIDSTSLPAFEPRAAAIDYELPRDGIDFAEFERAVLVQALSITSGNQTRAASLLGLTRDQIRYRMSKFGLVRPPASDRDEPLD